MPFPYSQTQIVELKEDDYDIGALPSGLNHLLLKSIQNRGIERKDEWFISTNSLFSIPFKFQVESIISSSRIVIKYKLHLFNLVNGVLIINILTAFFSRFQFETYLWFVFFASVFFYGLSWLIIRAGIKSMTLGFFSAYQKEEGIVEQETNPINYTYDVTDKLSCSACNALVESNDIVCKSCGIKLKQNPYTKPLEL